MRQWLLFLLQLVILLPLAIIAVGFAIANRQSVALILDPLSEKSDAFAITLPMYILVFASLLAGFLIGAFVSWLRAGRHRKAARHAKRDLKKLQSAMAATIITPSQPHKSGIARDTHPQAEGKTLTLLANQSARRS